MHPSHQRAHGPALPDAFLLLLRIAVVTVGILFQLAPEAAQGWKVIWNETAWPLAQTVSAIGVPQAQWVTGSGIVLAFLAAAGLCLGFMTRTAAAFLLAVTGFFGYLAAIESAVMALELSLVYGSIFLFFMLRGPGYLSADQYFRRPDG